MSLEKGKELALVQRAPIVIPDAQNLRVFVTDLMNSEFFKSVMKAPQAIAIVLYGQALGLEPVIALQTIQPVNGRMCISTTVLQALFQRKGGRVKVLERSEEKARVEFSFPGWDPYIHEYTKHDAIDEQLWEKDNWKKRRKTMLLYRAISGGLKVYDPGSHLGIVTTEEAEDYPNGLPEDAAVVPEKEKGSQKAPESAKEPVKQAPAAKKEASPAPGAAPAKEKPAEAQKEASKPQPAAQPKDASEPALTGFEVPEGEDDISAMAEHAESSSEEETAIQKIKASIVELGVDEKSFKEWLIDYQKKMKPPRTFLVHLGKSIRWHGAVLADLQYLDKQMLGAVSMFRYHDRTKDAPEA